MNADKDSILKREFRRAMDKSLPQPSWDEIEARAGGLALRWQERRKLVPALAALLVAVTIPALAFAAHEVFFASSPPPFESATFAFASVGGAPGKPADERSVVIEPRRVLTLSLANDKTAALWVSPTIDGNYCFAPQVVTGDPDSPGQGLAWGQGFDGTTGCGLRDRAFDVGFNVTVSSDGSHLALLSGGSGLQDADSVEVSYEDGSSTTATAAHVSSPVDALLFMFEIPDDHIASGNRPVELILRAEDGSVLGRDKTVLSNMWRGYDESVAMRKTAGPDTPGTETTNCGYDPTVPGANPAPGCTATGPVSWGATWMPNSPGYQFRQQEYPGNAHP